MTYCTIKFYEVRIDMPTKDGWSSETRTSLGERLTIPSCRLQCLVADVYDGTPLNRRLVSDSPRWSARDGLSYRLRPFACPMINSEKTLNGPSIWRVP